MTFDASVFWPAFRDVGMLKLATVAPSGGLYIEPGYWQPGYCGAEGELDAYVGYVEPDRERFGGGARSKEYEIEYQASELPDLAEGDIVTIWSDDTKTQGTEYKVREAPFVHGDEHGGGEDGTFKRALLTKI